MASGPREQNTSRASETFFNMASVPREQNASRASETFFNMASGPSPREQNASRAFFNMASVPREQNTSRASETFLNMTSGPREQNAPFSNSVSKSNNQCCIHFSIDTSTCVETKYQPFWSESRTLTLLNYCILGGNAL
jgi:hypothetical protein